LGDYPEQERYAKRFAFISRQIGLTDIETPEIELSPAKKRKL
jgi:hypothetical protein